MRTSIEIAPTLGRLLVVGTLVLLNACGNAGSGDHNPTPANSSASASDNSNALAADLSGQLNAASPKLSNVMELTISGLGTNNPQTVVNWVGTPAAESAIVARQTDTKFQAGTTPLLGFLDVAGVATSTMDAGGVRYIATRIKVRNAPACATPGTCAPYPSQRQNVTFFAVSMLTTINQTAVSRFRRFDGSDANPLLTTSLLPAHGLLQSNLRVDPFQASMQVYNEFERPPAEAGVTSVFPYGFVVKNANNGSRILPANPADNQYDGEVTFGFSIPLQPLPTDDPFKISMRFQTADDVNTRITQSTHEQDFFGDFAATTRATNLNSRDVTVLGGRIAQTPIGNPICRVRTAGTVSAPTGFLVNQVPGTPLVRSAPMNLSFVDRTSEVSIGFCETVAPPPGGSFVINGSQSGRRVNGGAYGGSFGGGVATLQANQVVWNIDGQRPYFPGEEVSFTATAGITNQVAVPITPFVGSFRVKGTTSSNQGTFGTTSNFAAGVHPSGVTVGDVNGDGRLDILVANYSSNNVSVLIGDGAGGFASATNFGVGLSPTSISLGDVNGDGRLDLVTANEASNNVSVLIGNGAGGFSAASNFAVGAFPASVSMGDVNGDGRLDIVTANSGFGDVSVLIGDGVGGFGSAAGFAVGFEPRSVSLGDLNGDGRLDIVTANTSGDDVSVLLGNGVGGFAAATNFVGGSGPRAVTLADVNGDGRLDVVTANLGGVVSVLIGNGAGGFTSAANFAAGPDVMAVALGDVNGDGRLDILTTVAGLNSVSVLFGNGAGGFASPVTFTVGASPFGVALGDLNGDGRLDIVTANNATNNASRLLGF